MITACFAGWSTTVTANLSGTTELTASDKRLSYACLVWHVEVEDASRYRSRISNQDLRTVMAIALITMTEKYDFLAEWWNPGFLECGVRLRLDIELTEREHQASRVGRS